MGTGSEDSTDPELVAQSFLLKGGKVKESLENIRLCHSGALQFCWSVEYVKEKLRNQNGKEALECQANGLDRYWR